jgi:hypothetical protein
MEMDATEEATAEPWKNLAKTVDEHPEWTETGIAKALKEAGGRYSPEKRRDFIASLPLAALEPYLGRLTIDSVQFWGRDPEQVRQTLTWEVAVTAHRNDKTTVKYVLIFEPLNGNLVALWQDS